MLTRRRLRLAFLARLVVVVLVAVFAWPTLSAACCVGFEAAASELAGAGDDCCPSAADDESGAPGEHHGACSCPLSCASGCTGLGRAVVVDAACPVSPPGSVAFGQQHHALTDPLSPDPLDILHIPKRVAA